MKDIVKEDVAMYRISGKQLVAIAMVSALFAVVLLIGAQRLFERSPRTPGTFGAGIEPVAIADPSVATEEQNNKSTQPKARDRVRLSMRRVTS
jgi:hypothetical protein